MNHVIYCYAAKILFNKFLDKSDSNTGSAAATLSKSQLAWLLKAIGAMALPDEDRQALLDEMEAADANMDSQLDFEEFLVFFNSILKVRTISVAICAYIYTIFYHHYRGKRCELNTTK